jgi:hypothetical protein
MSPEVFWCRKPFVREAEVAFKGLCVIFPVLGENAFVREGFLAIATNELTAGVGSLRMGLVVD